MSKEIKTGDLVTLLAHLPGVPEMGLVLSSEIKINEYGSDLYSVYSFGTKKIEWWRRRSFKVVS